MLRRNLEYNPSFLRVRTEFKCQILKKIFRISNAPIGLNDTCFARTL
jgi:hypothetical protein